MAWCRVQRQRRVLFVGRQRSVCAARSGRKSPFIVRLPKTTGVTRFRVGFRAQDGSVVAHVDPGAESATLHQEDSENARNAEAQPLLIFAFSAGTGAAAGTGLFVPIEREPDQRHCHSHGQQRPFRQRPDEG